MKKKHRILRNDLRLVLTNQNDKYDNLKSPKRKRRALLGAARVLELQQERKTR